MGDEAARMFTGQGDNYSSVPMCTRQAAETCFSGGHWGVDNLILIPAAAAGGCDVDF